MNPTNCRFSWRGETTMDDVMEILLVEDDPQDVELTLRALQSENLKNRIEVVRDGEEALDFLFCRGAYSGRSPNRPPKLVLLDLKLPKIDGMEVLRRIRADESTRLMPVIILTSSREEEDVVNGYHLGANSYICKPVDFVQFTEAVQQLKLYWLVLNEAPPAGLAKARRTPKDVSSAGEDR